MPTIGWWAEVPRRVSPTGRTLDLRGSVPVITTTADRINTPTPGALTLTSGTPEVTATDHKLVSPSGTTLTFTGGIPGLYAGTLVSPSGTTFTFTGGVPGVAVTNHKVVTPSGTTLLLGSQSPVVEIVTPLAYVNSAAGTGTSIAIPTHQIGDDIYVFTARNNVTPASKPSAAGTVPAWVDIDNNTGANGCSLRTAHFVATATTTTTGTWANAEAIGVIILHGSTGVGGHSESGGSSGDSTAPSVTLTNSTGSSAIIEVHSGTALFVGGSAPTGYTRRATYAPGTFSAGLVINTKDVTTSDGSVTQSWTNSGAHRGATIEVLD